MLRKGMITLSPQEVDWVPVIQRTSDNRGRQAVAAPRGLGFREQFQAFPDQFVE